MTKLKTIMVLFAGLCVSCQPVDQGKLRQKGVLVQAWEQAGGKRAAPPVAFGALERELFVAVEAGDLEHVKELVNRGASASARNERNVGAVEIAVKNNDSDMLHYLQRAGAVILADAVVAAVKHGRERCLNLLLEQLPELNRRTRIGSTPLIKAVRWGDPQIVAAFFAKGAQLEFPDELGRKPKDFIILEENQGGFPDVAYNYRQIATLFENNQLASTP